MDPRDRTDEHPAASTLRGGTGVRRALAVLIALVPLAALIRAPRADDAKNPPYPHGKFQADCALCHDADAWTPARISPKFDHGRFGFVLEGAHRAAACTACHTSLDFAQAGTRCASCHEDPHRGELGADCGSCHAARSFLDRGPMVRAHQLTSFPLTGSHAALDCESCHPPEGEGRLQFVNARAECLACHETEYRNARVDHVAAGFSTECRDCHSTLTWSTARVDHDRTAFPLTGAHRAVACASCHGDGIYAGKPTDCASCHMEDYDGATPDHAASNFPASACALCHNTTSWSGAVFDHSSTAFPLTGAHRNADCASCHGDGVYAGKPTDCASCHMTEYNGASPDHVASGFVASACASCHNTTSWSDATFDHSATAFPLTGAHVTTPCASCHGDGVYAGKSTDCASCHMNDYNNASPDHVAANFPASACMSCHNTTTWSGATFDHNSYFPIYSGAHAGRWNSCSDCHANPSNFSDFTCLSCHPHDDPTGTASHHSGVGGYVYESSACYSCHPRGRAD